MTLRPRLLLSTTSSSTRNAVADVDYTGAKVFGELVGELKERGISLSLARVSHLVHHDLKHSGLLAMIGPDHLFASVEEAVASLGPPGAPPCWASRYVKGASRGRAPICPFGLPKAARPAMLDGCPQP